MTQTKLPSLEDRIQAISDEVLEIKLQAFREGDILTARNSIAALNGLDLALQFCVDYAAREEETETPLESYPPQGLF